MITPEQFGLTPGTKDELTGGTPAENAEITRGILNGTIRGTKRNAVVLNAGAGIFIGGKADRMEEGVRMAEQLIDDGSAYRLMESYITESAQI